MTDAVPSSMPAAAPGEDLPPHDAGVSSFRFNAFLAGMTLSRLGDVAFAVALPWLVMQATGSNVALGTLMMVFAIPRGLLLLVGGATSDRFSARNVLLVSSLAQALCVAAIAALLAAHAFRFDMLYVLVFCFGVADAFATPAVNTLVPDLVARDRIPHANALVQTATQVCMLVGSALAGLLIQVGGLTMAFAADALSFVAILWALVLIPAARRERAPEAGLREAILAGLRHVWADPALRGLFILCACVNFCVTGVSEIGLVVLAKSRFDSAAALGFMMTGIGVGSLLGIAVGAKLPSSFGVGAALRAASVALGALFALLAVAMPMLATCGVALGIGVAAGCVNFKAITWLQMHVPADVTGRVMSVFSFASAGVMPLSLMIAGWLAKSHLETLMLSSAALLVLSALLVRPGARGA